MSLLGSVLHARLQPSPSAPLPSSHSSPASLLPLPQTGLQSLSVLELAPIGQHPSPAVAAVICQCVQATLHVLGLPLITSREQGSPSSQLRGHGLALLGSQVSEPFTRPSPQLAEQSPSESR